MMNEIGRRGAVEGQVPAYDQQAITKVVRRVEIDSVDLAGCFFRRRDEDEFPDPDQDVRPDFGIDSSWCLSTQEDRLSCIITFSTQFEGAEAPFELVARYRIVYKVEDGRGLSDDELTIFSTWNAVFNTWPYWREFVGATLARAQLPPIPVPVIRVPGWSKAVGETEVRSDSPAGAPALSAQD